MLTSSAAGEHPTGRPKGEIGSVELRGLSNRLGFLADELDNVVDDPIELEDALVVDVVDIDVGRGMVGHPRCLVDEDTTWVLEDVAEVFNGRDTFLPPLRPLKTTFQSSSVLASASDSCL